MSDKIYPIGVRTFSPREGAPDFVKGTIIIEPNTLITWLKDNKELLTDYKGEPQLKLSLLEGEKGLYTTVDTWKPEAKVEPVETNDDLPF